MRRSSLIAVLSAATILSACGQTSDPPNAAEPAPTAAGANVAAEQSQPPAGPPPAATNETTTQRPDLTPPRLTPEAERGVEGARNILLSFARAIELGEYDQAWSLLSAADKQKWSRRDFAALFADLPRRTVAIPDGTMEGAAGSSYYTAPIAINGNDREGRPVRIEGEAVLRRVNDVEGATPAQLRWHFERLTLNWTH